MTTTSTRWPDSRTLLRAPAWLLRLALHEDAAFADLCDHAILDEAGMVQKCVYDDGLEVEVNKCDSTYRISGGRAGSKGRVKL